MIAIADQSDISNPGQALAILAAGALLVGLARVVTTSLAWARRQQHWHDNPPAILRRPCHTTGCRYGATAMVMRRIGPNDVEVLDVCEGCADEGTAFGWWQRLDVWETTVP